MKRFSFRMTFVAILLHMFLVANSAFSQEKRGEKIIHGVIEKDPRTGAYRVKPESKPLPLQKKSFPKSKFDTQRFEKELTIQKRIASQQAEMKKLFAAQQTAKKEKQQKQILQQPKLKKIKFLGKETEFYEGPHAAKRVHSAFPTVNSISNVLVNGKQVDTIFTGDPFTLAFSLSPNMLSAAVRIYIDMNKNGMVDDADLIIVNNGLVIDNGEMDVNPATGEFKMNFPKGNFYCNFASTLTIEVDDYQSLSSAMLTIKEKISSKVIIGTITPALKSTVVFLNSYSLNNYWFRYVIPDSTGKFIVHVDTTALTDVEVQTFTVDKTPDGYVPPDTSFTIKKDTTQFTLSYISAVEFIEGYVKDQNGDPVKQAIIEGNSHKYIHTITDSLGYYKLGVVKDTWYVYFNPPSVSDEYLFRDPSYRYVQVGAHQTVRQDFVFLKSNSTISGSMKFGTIGIGGKSVYAFTDTAYTIDFTDANGNFILKVYKPVIGSTYYTVSTGADDNGYYIDSAYRPNISPGTANVNFVMKKTTGGMQGKVTDIHTGAPIINAEIDFSGNSSRYIYTNDSGYYKAGLRDGIYSLYVYASYYENYSENNIAVSGSFITKNILLTRTGSISGSVKDELGNPIPNASVYARDSGGYNYYGSSSDNQGKYVISGLMTSLYKAEAIALGFVSQWYDKKSVMDSATSFAVTKGFDTPNINFVLSRGGSISGIVKDKIGNGIPGVYVYAVDTMVNNIVSMSETDDSGHYLVSGLSTAKYYVAAASDSFLTQWYDGATNYTTATKVSVIINQNTPNVNFSLIRGGTMSGIVKDKGGIPIPNAQVYTLDTNYYYAQYTYTNDSGMYQINRIPPGIQRYVSATANGYSQRWYDNVASLELATSIIVLDEEKKENINFILPLGGKISGNVKNKAGTPIPYASVYVSQANGYNSFYGNTDELGNYTINGLNPGKYFVSAYQNEYMQQWYNHKSFMELADTIVVAEEQTISNINFNLSSGGKITGVVKNISGQPIQSVNIYASQTNGYNSYYGYSDELGKYTISNMPSGKYIVSAYQYEYIQQWYNHKSSMELADTIVVKEDSTTSNINFDLKPVPPPSTDSIEIRLKLANIPDTLVFSKTGLPDYYVDYWWGVRMDIDNDPSNGCEIELVVFHNQSPGEQEYKSTIIDGTYHVLMEWIGDVPYWRHTDVAVTIDKSNKNILVIKAPKDWLELNTISSSTKYFVRTSSQLGDKSAGDDTPLSSGFVPMNDPVYDIGLNYMGYVDILRVEPNIITSVDDQHLSEIPSSYSLAQNYPNPFNPSTTIAFDLPAQEHVTLKVYNIVGQEVATLVNEVRPAGRYSEKWAGTSISSGVYFYTLHSQSFTQTKKMIMLK